MNRLILSVVLTAFLAPLPASAAESLKAKVNGMVCAFCAQGIEAKLRALPQTKDVYVNLGQKLVAVQVKDGASLSADTVRGIVKDAGYEVSAIETVSKTAAEIKAETRKK
jgi:mercuric ion binding protein